MTTRNLGLDQPATAMIRAGFGFNVGQNFGRTKQDTPFWPYPEMNSGMHHFGWIRAMPESTLGFLRFGNRDGWILVSTCREAIRETVTA